MTLGTELGGFGQARTVRFAGCSSQRLWGFKDGQMVSDQQFPTFDPRNKLLWRDQVKRFTR
jgi:hypothetical protein